MDTGGAFFCLWSLGELGVRTAKLMSVSELIRNYELGVMSYE